MAIRKVTRIINGEEKEVLSLNDILKQIGSSAGTRIDFLSLAEVIGIPLTINGEKNPLILPEKFEGQDVVLSANTVTLSRNSYTYPLSGGSTSITISTTGVFSLSDVPSWIIPSATFGRNSTTLTFIGLSNSAINTADRSGSIKIYGTNNTVKATLNVSQPGNPTTATISLSGTVDLDGSDGETNIVVRLSTSLSPTTPVLSNTTDFSINTPSTSTAGGITTYTYKLTRFETSSNKSTTLDIGYSGDGYNSVFPTITFNQTGFQPTISRTPISLIYTSAGAVKYYDVTSNTNWTATISSPSFAYQHSLQSDRNFTFDALTGTSAGDRIYVKIGGNGSANTRTGTATITTTYGTNDVNTTVSLSQAGADTWDNDDITISGFAVASNGNITAPTVTTTGDTEYTIEYSDSATFATTVTAAAGFDLVSTDTTRYVRVSVTVPSGYSNTGETFTKDLEAIQGGLPTFKNTQITMEATRLFRVNSYGTITSPSVSVPTGITYTLRYTTGDNNTGSAYSSRFPKVSTAATRYANALVVVPAGYFNEGQTVIKTVDDTQEIFDPSISITTLALDFAIGGQTRSFVVNSNYSWVSVISNVSPASFEQSLDNVNFTTDNIIGGSANLDSTRNTTIYIKAPKNLGEDKIGAVNVTTNFGHLDNTDGVTLTQDGEPTFDIANDWTGTVSINRQTGAVSVTTGNSLTTPTFTPTSFDLVTATTNRTVSVTVKAPDGYNNHNSLVTENVSVSQLKFIPSVSTNVSVIDTFDYTGETLSYVITSNTTWSATISGEGFSHSTSPTSGFKTTAITGTSAGDTIHVKATGHLGAERYGTATVTTTFGGSDVSTDVDLTQLEAPTFTSSNISVSGFAVNYLGQITAPTSTPTATAIVYSTTQNGSAVSSFTVSTTQNQTRWCRVSVTVPAGYQNTGATVTRTNISTTQPFKATIDVEPESHIFSNVGSYKDYTVSSNTTWTVANYPSWITIDDTTGGGSDTKFRATAAAQANPAVLRSSTLRAYTNTSANGTFSDYVNIYQPARATWNIEEPIPDLGDEQWDMLNLKTTLASTTYFNFNIPYVFDYMNDDVNSDFDRTNFGFYVNFGAGRSVTSNRLTAGSKSFTMTANNDVAAVQNSISYDVGEWVSILQRESKFNQQTTARRYMIGTVTSWNQTTKVLTVNIPTSTSSVPTIVTNNSTTNYTDWEINQISGNSASFPRVYTRNVNNTGSDRTTTIKINDTNDAYNQDILDAVLTQSTAPLSGYVNIPSSIDANTVALDNTATYSVSDVVDTAGSRWYSVGIKTNFSESFTVTKTGSSSIWLTLPNSGVVRNPVNVVSTTTNTALFWINYNSPNAGQYHDAELTIQGGVTTTTLNIRLANPSSSGGTKPPIGLPPDMA